MCLVPHVLSCPVCLMPYVFLCLTRLVTYVLSFPTCLVPYLLSCLSCLVPYVPFAAPTSCLTCLVPYVPRGPRTSSHMRSCVSRASCFTCLVLCVALCLALYEPFFLYTPYCFVPCITSFVPEFPCIKLLFFCSFATCDFFGKFIKVKINIVTATGLEPTTT